MSWIRHVLGAAIFLTAVSARAQEVVVHPTKENLSTVGLVRRVGRQDLPTLPATLLALRRQLRAAERIDYIGTLDGSPETVLGQIRDVTVTPKGTVLVTDRANRAIRAFDARGTPLFTVGRDGSGPTDLRTPIASWSTGAGSDFAVFDAALGIKYFQRDSRGTVTLKKVAPLTVAMSAACATGNGIIALAMPSADAGDAAHLVRVLDIDGHQIRSFGSGYSSATRLVRTEMSEGQIGCTADGTVLTSMVKLPYVVAYDTAGRRMWTLLMNDFQIGRQLERRMPDGRARFGLDPDNPTASFTLQLREISPGFAIVQVGLMTPQSLKDRTIWSRIDTYLIDTRSGSAAFVSSTLPLIAGVASGRLFAFENDPYPRVLVYRLP